MCMRCNELTEKLDKAVAHAEGLGLNPYSIQYIRDVYFGRLDALRTLHAKVPSADERANTRRASVSRGNSQPGALDVKPDQDGVRAYSEPVTGCRLIQERS